MAKQGRVTKQDCGPNACWEPSQEESMEAEGLCLHRALWVDLLSLNLKISAPISTTRTLTGEPDARNSPVRFGGRGKVLSLVPTPILRLREERGIYPAGPCEGGKAQAMPHTALLTIVPAD